MNCNYSNTVAIKHGINSALILGYIEKRLTKSEITIDDYEWARITQKHLMGIFPFMGEKAVRGAVKRLRKAHIIVVKKMKKSHFDHGYFYTITAYGYTVIKGDDKNERKNDK